MSQVHSLSTWSSGPSALTPSFWPWDSTTNQKITLPSWISWTWSSQSSSLLSLPSSWLGLVSRSISKILGTPLILWLLLDLFLISLWQILVKEEQVSPCWDFSEPWDLSSSWQKESQFGSYYTPSSSHFRFEYLENLYSFEDFLKGECDWQQDMTTCNGFQSNFGIRLTFAFCFRRCHMLPCWLLWSSSYMELLACRKITTNCHFLTVWLWLVSLCQSFGIIWTTCL